VGFVAAAHLLSRAGQAFVITIGVSLVINCMTVFYCVLVVLVLGELNGARSTQNQRCFNVS
jgi:hypothetical protein